MRCWTIGDTHISAQLLCAHNSLFFSLLFYVSQGFIFCPPFSVFSFFRISYSECVLSIFVLLFQVYISFNSALSQTRWKFLLHLICFNSLSFAPSVYVHTHTQCQDLLLFLGNKKNLRSFQGLGFCMRIWSVHLLLRWS